MITIIILIILAGITINAVIGDNGLIYQAKNSKDMSSNEIVETEGSMNNLFDEYANMMAEDSELPIVEIPSTVEEAKESKFVFTEKTVIEDEHGNKITIPEGFNVPEASGDTVQEGIVIEDVISSSDENVQGSQYVWIPVGKFIKDDGIESNEIILGRYTFNTANGTPILQQNSENYTDSVVINSYYTELSAYREGIASSGTDGLNATAKDLQRFIESVNENGGYYIGRYEASFASGNSIENYKAASKVSTSYSTTSMLYKLGTLWNYITQINASKVAINTYADSEVVKSDLMNSYAWDTAIVYIQEAGNNNYANKKGTVINTNLTNTGTKQDEVCKINDMASNIRELTTEYSSHKQGNHANPCVRRGGNYNSSTSYTAYRNNTDAADFRVSL